MITAFVIVGCLSLVGKMACTPLGSHPSLYPPKGTCPGDADYAHYHICYKVSTIAKSWHDARMECLNWGGHMNEIDHKENHEEIAEHSEGKNIWTGLRYYGSDTSYKYQNTYAYGTNSDYKIADLNGQAEKKDCVIIDQATGDYTVADCSELHHFVCQRYAEDTTCNKDCSLKNKVCTYTPYGAKTSCKCAGYTAGKQCGKTRKATCADNPCRNGGTCKMVLSAKYQQFYCDCAAGYKGRRCGRYFE